MKRRDFVKMGAVLTTGAIIAPLTSCSSEESNTENQEEQAAENSTIFTPFVLPDLDSPYTAWEPTIDAMTMETHHSKHHQGYVNKLNAALENHPLQSNDLPNILANITNSEDDIAVRNNGGGHFNHSLFWENISVTKVAPSEDFMAKIDADFGSFKAFKEEFVTAAATRFGSGWAWLSVDTDGKLFVSSTPNQDNPLMKNIVEQIGTPILGIDVWEHAYYLQYQNLRKEYINNFFSIINWFNVSQNFEAAIQKG